MSERERETKHISELPAVDIRFLLAFELISWWLSVVFLWESCSNFFFFLSSFCRKQFGESLPKFIPHLSRWFCTFWCIFCVSAREADKSYWIIHDKSFENNSSPTFFSSSDFHSSHFSASNLNLRLVFRKRGTLKSTQIQHNDWTMTLLRRCAEHMLATSTWSSTIIPLNFPPSTCSRGSIVHVSLVCSSSFFFPFWTFPALRGCNLCADLRMCLLQSTLWVGDLTALCFTGAVIDWCHSRSPGRSGCGAQLATGDWKNPSQSPGRDIQQLQHERLEAVKSKWEDVFRAFCVFITRIYGRIPGCDTA